MLAKNWWEFSNKCITNISISNNFIGVRKLIPRNKSHSMNFLIYYQQINLLVIDLSILDN